MKSEIRTIETQMKGPLEELAIADPELAVRVRAGLNRKFETQTPAHPVSPAFEILADETIWGLSQERSFGHAIAEGFVQLIGDIPTDQLRTYQGLLHESGENGPELGRIMATHLVPVLKHGQNGFLKGFLHTIDVMRTKGTYTLKISLSALSTLLNTGDVESGDAYLGLLRDTFSQEMAYNESLYVLRVMPKAVLSFSPSKRHWQIGQFRRVVRQDFHLMDAFVDGMEKGLHLLSEDALTRFVCLGLEKFEQNQKLGIKFLSLVSKLGADACSEMQVSVSFSQLQQQLNRYLRARTGISISVRPLSSMPKSFLSEGSGPHPLVCSDGKFIYLPDEISIFPSKAENASLYKCLTKIESAYYEFQTFDFDFEKAMMRCVFEWQEDGSEGQADDLSDFERFFSLFPNAALAADLFTIFEHGRIRVLLNRFYPGIVRQYFPMMEQAADQLHEKGLLSLLYLRIALGISPEEPPTIRKQIRAYAELFERKIAENSSVETCAELVCKSYEALKNKIQGPLETPFARKLRPDLFFSTFRHLDRISKQIKVRLEEKGLKTYQSDIRKHMIENNGNLSPENIREIVLQRGGQDQGMENISSEEIREMLRHADIQYPLSQTEDSDAVAWYKEWDCNLGDYVRDHVRVLDKTIGGLESDFYPLALTRHQGLVKQIRHAFELLKPEGLLLLRQWVEGDEFDYRALLDFALDKKAGIMPSDRLYIKRVKQQRDVAVLLLVDLSRSTSNLVSAAPGQHKEATVLDVEKEAIVLFCEALGVVGDTFGIAGFSGTGRLGVDYFRIKDFDEAMDDTIRNRISAMSPQRSTRMGGAIRHATRQLENVAAKVRLMIILGDGFPNDINYKREYAIEDTHKAISEARAKSIHTRAITVNIAGDSKLDDLYGSMHHNVISDVRELPDKLLRIYRAMTR